MPHFFLSYRRSDREGRGLAHSICRELRRRYGEENVFLDVDSRRPGLSFPVKVKQALDITDAVLVIIGPEWLQRLTERLGDSRDWVRYEVAESLKRSPLPVVPVCLAGVEMPQPHQLPEELKELGFRDGVTLDPFEDFESHLARLMTDLERVLADLAREKAKAEAAERAAAQARKVWRDLEKAGEAPAPARAARPSPAPPSVPAPVPTASTTPKAVAPAAAPKAAAPVAEPKAVAPAATPKAAGPVPTPKAASPVVAPKAAPSLPAKTAAASGASVKTPAAKYKLPPSYTAWAVIVSLAVSGIMIFALAFGYSYSLLRLAFVQLNFILTLLYGVFSGLAAGFALRRRKVWSEGTGWIVGLVAGFGALYLSWAVWLYGHSGLFETFGFLGLLNLISSPAWLWRLLGEVNKAGAWDIWGYKPTGAVLWLFWSLEALLIVGLSTFSSFGVISDTTYVFCERCGRAGKWKFGVANLRSCEAKELKRHLEVKDLAFLETLGPPPPKADQKVVLDLIRCEKCKTTNILNARVEDSKGKRESVTWGLLMTAAECDTIERIGKEAAKRTES